MNDFKADLKKAQTVDEALRVIAKHYDTSARIGIFNKGLLMAHVDKFILTLGLKPKK